LGRESDDGGSKAGGPGGADDPGHRAAGGSGARAARQDYSRGRRVHRGGKAGHGGQGDPGAAGRDSTTLFADAGGDRRGEEYYHRVPAAGGYTDFIGPGAEQAGGAGTEQTG